MICLYDLHAAGADVVGDAGDAWLRCSAVRNDRDGLMGRIREAHHRLGRRVLPTDLDRREGSGPTGAGVTAPTAGTDQPRDPATRTPGASPRRSSVAKGTPSPTADRLESQDRDAPCDNGAHVGRAHGSGTAPAGKEAPSAGGDEPDDSRERTGTSLTQPPEPDPMPSPLIDRLLAAASARNLTRAALCQALDMSSATLHALRHGKASDKTVARVEAWLAGAPAAGAPATGADPQPTPARQRIVRPLRRTAKAGGDSTLVGSVLAAMGLSPRSVYVIEQGALVERTGVLL